MSTTRILLPLNKDYMSKHETGCTDEMLAIAQSNWAAIEEAMSTLDEETTMSFDEWLRMLELTEAEYYLAIRTGLPRPAVLMKRRTCEVWINTYVIALLLPGEEIQLSNMDVQVCFIFYNYFAHLPN